MDRYRIYFAAAGSDLEFCGEYFDLGIARLKCWTINAAGRRGLPASDWETAHAAGQVAGMKAPDPAGEEDEDPIAWFGDYCVVRTRY